ncbi:MAG: tRNA pseudouridine(55) synthase TruB [Alphaproteobacteria bacterium]|nr:tRNA pseudouridine(55) synthase TruB [Alphaproteobacteria bacterium]
MSKHRRLNLHGWINLNKPAGMTSTQAVGAIRRLLNVQKLGHAGTLDPLATGILPIALGEATKVIPFAQDALKTYEFTITWGEQRDTDDAEGAVIATSEIRPGLEEIANALPRFIGEIEQIPPRYSAIKIDGQRAYDLAREGEEFEIKPRRVFVQDLKLCPSNTISAALPLPPSGEGKTARSSGEEGMTKTTLIMTCGKGTYVRSLARDLAEILGTRGYISALKRTAVGGFTLENAISLDNLEKMADSAARNQALLPLDSALDDILALPLKPDEATRLRNGQVLSFVSRPDFKRLEDAGLTGAGEHIALARLNESPVAIVAVQGATLKSVRIFNL